MSECICDQCEIDEENCPANQAMQQVVDLTARAEQAEAKLKEIQDRA